MNMKWDELIKEVGQGRPVKIHSNQVQPGDVFLPLPGTRVKGVEFIGHALERGAKYIVTDNILNTTKGLEDKFVIHPDPREALGELARTFYKTDAYKYRLIGITGTNGKTTVAYLLENLLQALGYSVGVIGTVSYRWPGFQQEAKLTTPDCLTLHKMLAEMGECKVDVICMEVSSHALSQKRVAGLSFDWVIFTNLSQEHLDYHQDMESYFKAKSRLFSSPLTRPGSAVVNLDDPYGQRLLTDLNSGFGFGLDCHQQKTWPCLQGTIRSSSKLGLKLAMTYNGQTWQLETGLIGEHNALNLLATQAIGLKMGINPADFSYLSSFDGVPGRLERVVNKKGYTVFIDYAHTPEALKSVLSALIKLKSNKLVVVFGCGGDRDRDKRPLMGQSVASYADIAILTSDNPRHEDPVQIMQEVLPGLQGGALEVMQEVDRYKAIEMALEVISKEDILLIAGKGHETYQEIRGERKPFSDSRVVQSFLELDSV